VAPAVSQVEASEPTVKALLSEAARANYLPPIALGVSAPARWSGAATFRHDDRTVRVVPCVSALAARRALLDRNSEDWLVIVTDRPADDLGDGILAHLAWQRLRNPDAWNAVLETFGARLFDPALEARGRALAEGLLVMTPPGGWPAAPAGMLTRDRALGSVAAVLFAQDAGRVVTDLDLDRVLRWSMEARTADAVRAARSHNGEVLFGAVADWLAEQCGDVAPIVRSLLLNNRAADLLPLGLVTQVVRASAPGSGPRALLSQQTGAAVPERALLAWSAASVRVARAAFARRSDSDMPRALARAETLLDQLQAGALAEASEILPRSLDTRLAVLGTALTNAAAAAASKPEADRASAALVAAERVPAVEAAWAGVLAHALHDGDGDRSVSGAEAGVRLARWLAREAPPAADFASALTRFRDDESWADRAVNDAWNATEIPELRAGLNTVLAATRLRRSASDSVFATRLAAATKAGHPAPAGAVFMEDALTSAVADLPAPILLVVADGMSLANAAQIVDSLTAASGWWECVPQAARRRLLSIGALPTVTRVCRTSLLSGHLADGDQGTERDGLQAWGRAHHRSVALFHKLALDSSRPGSALADNVRAAIDDTAGVQIVACVVNTIDDALDRSDPGGTDWTADSVKLLRPLLEQARRAGRTVVLTSDHGHVIERRQGHTAPGRLSNSNRWRPATGPAATPEEALVEGARVVAEGHRVVLAVDEQLRYSVHKAGYHGGAAPAEVAVPVIVLSREAAPAGWELAPPQAPGWWREPAAVQAEPVDPAAVRRGQAARTPDVAFSTEALFEIAPTTVASTAPVPGAVLVASLRASAVWQNRSRQVARRQVSDDQIAALITALAAAADHRIPDESAAAALAVATVQLPGAFAQVQRLLNVEQYPVIIRSEGLVLLDVALLAEQFELPS
jgi:hypothetical protein